jgi:putative cell wall-binding protein
VLRRIASLVLVAAAIAVAAPVAADYGNPALKGPLKPMTFPVAGRVSFSDTFGAPRTGHTHAGQDLMGAKMTPLVATVDGVVTQLTIPEPSYGYALVIRGDDGWTYHYLHINNDTPGTDDGRAPLDKVFGPGITKGSRVMAGQLVAFLGDSGNAVNPMASLEAAHRLAAPVGLSSSFPRLSGEDRLETAVAISRAGWADGASEVVIASAERYAEALPASVLAARLDVPLLLTAGPGLADVVGTEISRLKAGKVTIVGSVPTTVDDGLRAYGFQVTRIAGADPVSTAAALARAMGPSADKTVVLVNSDKFADGISAAGIAVRHGWPVLLSGTSTIPQASVDAYRALGTTRTVLVGGTAVLADGIARFVPGALRLAGEDRYATSAAVAERLLSADPGAILNVHLATGSSFPDSLAAGALVARTRGLLLLVDGTGQSGDGASLGVLQARKGVIGRVTLLGGWNAIGFVAVKRLESALLGF